MKRNEKLKQKLENIDTEKGIFSPAIFRQSAKSQKVLWLFTTIGNCLISLVVILILSSLTVNTTKNGLANLFSTADMENTIKSTAAESYAAYDNSILAYEGEADTLSKATTTLYKTSGNVMDGYSTIVNDKIPLINQTYGKFIINTYNTAFNSASGTDEEKHDTAKANTKTIVKAYTDNSSMDTTVKAVVPYFIDSYLNDYYVSKSTDIPALTATAFPEAGKNYILSDDFTENLGYSKASLSEACYSFIENTITKYRSIIDNGDGTIALNDKYKIQKETSKEAVLSLAPANEKEQASSMFDVIITRYMAKPDLFDGDIDDYFKVTKAMAISEVAKATAKDFAYFEKLPSFTVEYSTDDKGCPYYLDQDKKEVEITSVADRDKMIPIKEGMGTDANFLQKKYKELLTGTDYTEEEKKQAQKDSETLASSGYDLIYGFLVSKYIVSPSTYYDSTNKVTIKDNIIKEVVTMLKDESGSYICENFKVDSLADLTESKYGISGEKLLEQVGDYATSAISVYEKRYQENTLKGYDLTTAFQVSICQAGLGITDQLPSKIKNNLSEMSTMNLYAIIIGFIFFACSGLLLPMVYVMMTANDLIAGQVDSGSMAFILSTPTKRKKISFTQWAYLNLSLFAQYLLLFLVTLIAREIGVAAGSADLAESLPISQIALDSLGAFAVMFCIAGICFMSSCIFNKTKESLGLGGGITIFFLVTSILGIFGSSAMPATIRIDAMNSFNYMTVIRLFDIQAVIDNNLSQYWWKLSILFIVGAITSISGALVFDKKDLPL